MQSKFLWLVASCCIAFGSGHAYADLALGVLSDFQDGTDQGWAGGTVVNVADAGPAGIGDHALQLSNGGTGGNFAMFNPQFSGVISAGVTSISCDILRPAGSGAAEVRLVLFDLAGDRWTSFVAANVIDDGSWNNYVFSIAEVDLSHVVGSGSYGGLVNSFSTLMFRYDPGSPSSGGSPLSGSMSFDNITAIPEPTAGGLLQLGLILATRLRRHSRLTNA